MPRPRQADSNGTTKSTDRKSCQNQFNQGWRLVFMKVTRSVLSHDFGQVLHAQQLRAETDFCFDVDNLRHRCGVYF